MTRLHAMLDHIPVSSIPQRPSLLFSLLARVCVVEQAGGLQEQLRYYAFGSLGLYAVGIPALFLIILGTHGASIRRDQSLKVQGKGATEATNPDFSVRRRYQKL